MLAEVEQLRESNNEVLTQLSQTQDCIDLYAFLASRPYRDEAGNTFTYDGQLMAPDYFDRERSGHYDRTLEPYGELNLSGVADKLAYAEAIGDKTMVEDLSDVLLDKIIDFSDSQVTARYPEGMTAEAQSRLFDRVMKLKDRKKSAYEQNAALASPGRDTAVVQPKANATAERNGNEYGVSPAIHMEYGDENLAREYRKAYDEADKQPRGEDKNRLEEKAAKIGSEYYHGLVTSLALSSFKSWQSGDREESERLETAVNKALWELLDVKGIVPDSAEAKAYAGRISHLLSFGTMPQGTTATEHEEDTTEDMGASYSEDSPRVAWYGIAAEEKQPGNGRLRNRWSALKSRVRGGYSAERQSHGRHSRIRRFIGAATLVAVSLTGGYLAGNTGKPGTRPASHTDFAKEQVVPDGASRSTEARGETSKKVVKVNHSPDEIRRIMEYPEQFQRMVKWYKVRTNEIFLSGNGRLTMAEAAAETNAQFMRYITLLGQAAARQAG